MYFRSFDLKFIHATYLIYFFHHDEKPCDEQFPKIASKNNPLKFWYSSLFMYIVSKTVEDLEVHIIALHFMFFLLQESFGEEL